MHVRKKDLNKKNEEKLLGMGTCKKADTPFQLHEEVGRDSNVALAIGVVFGSDAFTCFPRLLSAAIPGAKLLQGWGFPRQRLAALHGLVLRTRKCEKLSNQRPI
jgi:hypothetical protein